MDPRGAGLFRSGSTRRYSFRDQISKLDYQLSWCLDQKATLRSYRRCEMARVQREETIGRGFHGCTQDRRITGVYHGGPRRNLVRGSDRVRSPAVGVSSALRSSAKRCGSFLRRLRSASSRTCRETTSWNKPISASRKTALLAPDDESAPAINTFASTKILRMLGVSFAPDLFALLFETLKQIRQTDAILLHDGREFFRQLWQEG